MMNKILEEWRDIAGYENLYKVSNLGRVKSFKGGVERILLGGVNSNGYRMIHLYLGKKRRTAQLHKLVMVAFGMEEAGKITNHKDGNKLNNRADNLEACTYKENSRHSIEIGRQVRRFGNTHPMTKMSTADCIKALCLLSKGKSTKFVAEMFGMKEWTIQALRLGQKRKFESLIQEIRQILFSDTQKEGG